MVYNITGVTDASILGSVLGGMIAAFFLVFMVLFVVAYVYLALALMVIAKKTKTKYAWLAWIPVANIYLMTQIAGVQWWTMLFLLFAGMPVLGDAIVIGLIIYWWWNIAETRKMPGWLGILMAVPIVNFVVIGILAWNKK